MYRLVSKSIKKLCKFVPKDKATITKKDKVFFYGKNTMPNTIFRVKQNRLPATIAASIINSSTAPLTVLIKKGTDIVTNTINPNSSLSFIHHEVQKIKIIGSNAPYKGEFDYQATYKKK